MILLESNQNHATAKNTEVCTTLAASMGMGGGYVPMVVDTLVFDESQITSPINGNHPKWGDACHTLSREAGRIDIIIQECEDLEEKTREACNWDGTQISPTLTARNAGGGQRMPDKENFNAVMCYGLDRAAYNQGKNAQYDFSVEEEMIGAQVSRGPGAVAVISAIERGMDDATARNPILRLLRETYGAQEVVKWGTRVLAALQSAEILQQGLHEESNPGKTENWNELDDSSLPCPPTVAEWLLRNLREREERGCPSQGRESAEQRSEQLTETLQELPHENAQAAKVLCDMWEKGERLQLLQQTLREIQEIWESALGEWERRNNAVTSVVRRLTPPECCALQGFPMNWTLIGKPEEVEVKDYITEWIPGKNCKYQSISEALADLAEQQELIDSDDLDDESVEDMGGDGFDPKKYGFVKKRTQVGSHTEIQYIYTDRNGKRRRCADSSRYKAIGNSIAVGYANRQSGFWMWLMKRISAQYERSATLGSLFDGIGGFPLAWEFYNGKGSALWASEIEDFCIEVTRRRFPDPDDPVID